MKKEYLLEGLDCANCANKIERAINQVDDIDQANINFMTQKLSIQADKESFKHLVPKVQEVISSIESHVKITETQKDAPKLKIKAFKIALSALLLVLASLLPSNLNLLRFVLFAVSYMIVAYDVLAKATGNIRKGQVFDENFLMSIATIGAFLIGEYPEGVAVMLFYQVGELFQMYAVGESRKSIANLMDIRPDAAHLKKDGEIITVDPQEVQVGDIIIIKPGERIPLDAQIVTGFSSLDTSALTGESFPSEVEAGDEILSGCINITGLLEAKVLKLYSESTVSKILDLVENASSKKSQSEQFITKFARYYTPIVVIIATLLVILPPLFIAGASFDVWIYRALSFLVVSCPCALVISIPLSFFGGIGGASKQGILVKGSNYLETLSKVDTVVFDKTGTLTQGVFKVQTIHAINFSEQDLLYFAAHAEHYSNHPISTALTKAYPKNIDESVIEHFTELPGHGIQVTIDQHEIAIGNTRMMDHIGIHNYDNDHLGTIVHIAINQQYAGYIIIADEIKPDSKSAISELKKQQIKKTVMLTGDHHAIANKIGTDLGLDAVYSELLPQDKVSQLEALLADSSEGKLAFVGDGINDAPVLARADIGIAMGGLGSDAAIEAADVVIMTDQPSKIATAITISHKTLRIVYQNIIMAIGIKVIVLLLSALGLSTMWHAIFADVGVTIIAVLNALRALNAK